MQLYCHPSTISSKCYIVTEQFCPYLLPSHPNATMSHKSFVSKLCCCLIHIAIPSMHCTIHAAFPPTLPLNVCPCCPPMYAIVPCYCVATLLPSHPNAILSHNSFVPTLLYCPHATILLPHYHIILMKPFYHQCTISSKHYHAVLTLSHTT